MTRTIQFFPWPPEHQKAQRYRNVTTNVSDGVLKQARPGDLLDIQYDSGRTVQGRIFSIRRDLSARTITIQVEPCITNGRRLYVYVAGKEENVAPNRMNTNASNR